MESPQLLQHKKPDNYVEAVDGDSINVEGALELVLRCCRGVGVAPLRTSIGGGPGWRAVLSPILAVMQAVVMTLLMETVDSVSIYVEGALGLVLCCCRGFGVAPLRTSIGGGPGWRAVLSPSLAVKQAVVMILLNLASLTGLILDFCQKLEKRARVGGSFMEAFIWISDLVLVMVIASIAVYTAPAQMKCLQRVLTQIEQIKLELNMSVSPARTEKIKSIALFSLLIWIIIIIIIDFASHFRKSAKKDAIWIIMTLYSSYYVANIQGVFVTMRWSLTAQAVHTAAATINLHLQWLLQANLNPEPNLNDLQDIGSTKTVVDLLKQTKASAKTTGMGSKYSTYPSQVQVIIRRLALSHERVNEMMRQMNDTNGLLLLAILMSTFLRLVLTPYYMLSQLCMNVKLLQFSSCYFHDDQDALFEVFLPLNWSLILMTILMLTIEPCHWTHVQRERTGILLGQVIVHMAPKCHRVSKELDQFAKQIVLSDAKFMPFGVYVLSRPLIATMLGSVTTYLLIIIQFDAVSKQL